jgi:hypothetical protein
LVEACRIGSSNIRWASQTTQDGADDLGGEERQHAPTLAVTAPGEGERHHRIEMRAGNRPEHDDQGEQGAARGDGIGEQRQPDIPNRQALGHDPRADHGGEQQRRTDRLGEHRLDVSALHVAATSCTMRWSNAW